MNHKKCQRLWREEGLRVKVNTRRKRAGRSTTRALVADAPDVVWAIDFQFDATTDGRPIKIANVIDEHTRQALGGQVARSIIGDDLVAELGRIAAARGRWPVAIRCDNGPELICQALADECAGRVGLSFIDPGCPWQNPYVESFLGRLRDECLNLHHFAMLLEAKVVIDNWRAEYNTVRPHSAPGYQPPARYAAHCTHQHQQQDPELSKPLDQ